MFGSGKTILIVDDEASQRKQMRDALRAAGYHVLIAGDYDAAVNIHQRRAGPIHLLVTDLALSGKNGFELASTLLAGDPNLKVLFTSGQAGAELRKFYGIPAIDASFLEKPFLPAELVQRVRALLEPNGAGAAASG
jgi:DNA-binding response OmpR family regulator